jgi:heptosyltransferase I
VKVTFDRPRPLNILITRLSAHGDVIQTLPLLAELKALYPECRIGWLVETSAAPLLQDHPLIDQLHVAHRKEWLQALRKPWLWLSTIQAVGQFIQNITAAHYNVSVDVQGLLKSAIWPVLAGIPKRFGFAHTREYADYCYTNLVPAYPMADTSTSTVDRFRAMAHYIDHTYLDHLSVPLQPLAFPMPPIKPDALATINEWLATTTSPYPVIALAPHTIWPSKHWPAQYWETLLTQLMALPVTIVLLGSPTEAESLEQLAVKAQSQMPHTQANLFNWGGKTNWSHLQALMAHRLSILIGLDSALLHLASAVAYGQASSDKELPLTIIGLFGPTSVMRTGPLSSPNALAPHVVLQTTLACQPCLKRRCPLQATPLKNEVMACMTHLTPTMVYDQVITVLHSINLPSAC